MRIMVKYIGMISAFKVGCLMSLLPLLCGAAVFLLYPVVISNGRTSFNCTGALVLPMLIFGVIGAFLSGVGAAFQALVYNVVALIFGGIEIRLTDLDAGSYEKQKQGEAPAYINQLPPMGRYSDHLPPMEEPKTPGVPRPIYRGEKR